MITDSTRAASLTARVLITLLILLCCLGGYHCSYAKDAVPNLASLLAAMNTLQANFTQTITDDSLQVLQQAQGVIYLVKAGSLRWEVKRPIPQILVVHQQRVWLYEPELQQVVIKPLNAIDADAPALLLTKQLATTISKNFGVVTVYSKNKYLWYKLQPKTPQSRYQFIELGFFRQKLHAMRFKDNLGHITNIKMDHISYNQAIDATIFTLQLPTNTDVIDET